MMTGEYFCYFCLRHHKGEPKRRTSGGKPSCGREPKPGDESEHRRVQRSYRADRVPFLVRIGK